MGNMPQWLVVLVRNYLTRTPQFGQIEFELLGESNRQLLALDRNLNQIAKVVREQENTGPHWGSVNLWYKPDKGVIRHRETKRGSTGGAGHYPLQ